MVFFFFFDLHFSHSFPLCFQEAACWGSKQLGTFLCGGFGWEKTPSLPTPVASHQERPESLGRQATRWVSGWAASPGSPGGSPTRTFLRSQDCSGLCPWEETGILSRGVLGPGWRGSRNQLASPGSLCGLHDPPADSWVIWGGPHHCQHLSPSQASVVKGTVCLHAERTLLFPAGCALGVRAGRRWATLVNLARDSLLTFHVLVSSSVKQD